MYIAGDIPKEEVKEATSRLYPDEVEYDGERGIKTLTSDLKVRN